MRKVLRNLGIFLLLIVVLLAALLGYVYFQSESIVNQHFSFTAPDISLPEVSEEVLAEGRRIFTTRGCSDCHGANAGGTVMVDDVALGRIIAPNLTSGEGGLNYNQDQFVNAIMHGVSSDGRGLVIMPSQVFTQWREEDIAPLLVFLLNTEPVDNVLPATNYGFLGRGLLVAGVVPMGAVNIDHETVGLIEIAAEPSIEYGRYLYNNCIDCHQVNAVGGPVPGSDYSSANLTPSESGIGAWSMEDFMTTIRTGIRPDGVVLDPAKMPWPSFVPMTDVELQALYTYLTSLEPVENEN
jgi:mono/diheme cytochrome c family protein